MKLEEIVKKMDMINQQQTRRQPFLFVITTAGTVRENIYDRLYSYCSNIALGVDTDDTFLSLNNINKDRRNINDRRNSNNNNNMCNTYHIVSTKKS